jgi:hypothetical protein
MQVNLANLQSREKRFMNTYETEIKSLRLKNDQNQLNESSIKKTSQNLMLIQTITNPLLRRKPLPR